jgi:hypothetical protein
MMPPRPYNLQPDGITGVQFGWSIGGYHMGGHAPVAPIVGDSPSIIAHSGGGGGSIGWADIDLGYSAMITHTRFLGGPLPFVDLGAAIREVVCERSTS